MLNGKTKKWVAALWLDGTAAGLLTEPPTTGGVKTLADPLAARPFVSGTALAAGLAV